MIDLAIVVEGESEELFVKRLLAPHLWVRNVFAWPVVVIGSRSWVRVKRDVVRLLKERAERRCAILFDFYGLKPDWPGRAEAKKRPVAEHATAIESALIDDVAAGFGAEFRRERFLPHIQLHEFEARLFSDCEALGATLGVSAERLRKIVVECGGPEQIDGNYETAPSRRLHQLCIESTGRGYRKTTDGVTASERVTLATMRSECPHFAEWLGRVESLV
ncbi:MAG: hypothetical protein AMXMBFR47_28180 [Planctomycetota bacterium]